MSEFKTIYIHTGGSLPERLKLRKHCGPYQWTPAEPGKGRGFYQSSKGLSMGDGPLDLRLKLANDCEDVGRDLSRIDGYWTNEDCDESLTPIIALLPRSRGFLAGWTMGKGMYASIGAEIYDSEREAARAAHHDAEYAAEREREYQAEENARIEEEERQAEIEQEENDKLGAEESEIL